MLTNYAFLHFKKLLEQPYYENILIEQSVVTCMMHFNKKIVIMHMSLSGQRSVTCSIAKCSRHKWSRGTIYAQHIIIGLPESLNMLP